MDRISQLKNRIDLNAKDRARYIAQHKERADTVRIIREAFAHTRMGFWCDKCRHDFEGIAHKEIREPSDALPYAWYVGHCPKKHEAIRRITEKQGDPYYRKSQVVRAQRLEMADAMLTPDHPRFRMVYPEQWRKIKAEMEHNEELAFNQLKSK
jgi:hypothetical protein